MFQLSYERFQWYFVSGSEIFFKFLDSFDTENFQYHVTINISSETNERVQEEHLNGFSLSHNCFQGVIRLRLCVVSAIHPYY